MLCKWFAARLDHLRDESKGVFASSVPELCDGRLQLLHAERWYLVIWVVVASVVVVLRIVVACILVPSVVVVIVVWVVGAWWLLCVERLVEGSKDVGNGLSVRLLCACLRRHVGDQGLFFPALDAANLLQPLKLQQDVLDLAPAMDALQDLDFFPDELAQLSPLSHVVAVEVLPLCDQVVELVPLVVCVVCRALVQLGCVDDGFFHLPASFVDLECCREVVQLVS